MIGVFMAESGRPRACPAVWPLLCVIFKSARSGARKMVQEGKCLLGVHEDHSTHAVVHAMVLICNPSIGPETRTPLRRASLLL